jgi:hypothetical protein
MMCYIQQIVVPAEKDYTKLFLVQPNKLMSFFFFFFERDDITADNCRSVIKIFMNYYFFSYFFFDFATG